jgi:hypothetical protein
MKTIKNNYPIKECVCVSPDEFNRILSDIFGDNVETEYSMDGLWVGNSEGELPLEDGLSEYFGREVSSIHLDDCDYVGVWIVFA